MTTKKSNNDPVEKNSKSEPTQPLKRVEAEFSSPIEQLCPRFYNKKLKKLPIELGKLQVWIRTQGMRVAILFEG